MIELINVNKIYKNNSFKVIALNNINLKFKTQEFVCIHGPSGCGKTTLLNIIGGLDKYSSGNLIIRNQNTINFNDSNWDSYRNQSVGFVFQNYYLLPHLTVFENIELSLTLTNIKKNERKKRVIEALTRVGLRDEIYKYPKQLSGGQMQRVAIARAIINNPDIILADEPTGALDSVNAESIMKILKEISNERLVVMVSHNYELAQKYATRVVELFDGEIIKDTRPLKNKEIEKKYNNIKTSISLGSVIKLSVKNLLRTKMRSILTIIASCIGIIGVGLVLSISKGVNIYIEEVQKSALGNYPITISSSARFKDKETNDSVNPKKEFPETDYMLIRNEPSSYDYYNVIDEDFLNYLKALPPHLYSVINYNTTINMNLLSKTSTSYQKVSQYRMNELSENDSFNLNQYDLLRGSLPQEANEVALLIDKYNSLDVLTLSYLGIDYLNRQSYTFDELLNKEFKLIFNDDFYKKDENRYYYSSAYYQQLYETTGMTLKITAIMRIKPNANTDLYTNGLLYTPTLRNLVLESSRNSEITQRQIENYLDYNVFSGLPFKEQNYLTVTYSKEYQYKQNLIEVASEVQTTRIHIYTSSFHDRLEIKSYIDSYKNEESTVNIHFYDYMNTVTTEFASLVKVFSTVLIIFSMISLIVSSIMIGVITYVSVIERTKEIGLLRSIGARKKDISRLFNVETIVIGFFAGILGIFGVIILLKPVNEFVQKMIKEYTVSFSGISKIIVARFELKYILILLFGSMLLTLIAGFIPSYIASRKRPIDALKTER